MRLTIIVGLMLALLAGCKTQRSTQERGERLQEGLMQRAIAEVPVPTVDHFLTRKTVAKWMRRQDVTDRPHYVYIFADTGQVIGYYVAQSRPVSICTFMTPTKRVVSAHGTRAVLPSPGLDGVYYGGGACDEWYFFDAATDAMVEISGFKMVTSDQPLKLEAQPILVQGGER